MFGRLKLALVALVLLPAVALAAEPARHAPGPSPEIAAVATKIEATVFVHKHRSLVTAIADDPSTVGAFLDGLRDVLETLPAANTKGFTVPIATFVQGGLAGRHQPT